MNCMRRKYGIVAICCAAVVLTVTACEAVSTALTVDAAVGGMKKHTCRITAGTSVDVDNVKVQRITAWYPTKTYDTAYPQWGGLGFGDLSLNPQYAAIPGGFTYTFHEVPISLTVGDGMFEFDYHQWYVSVGLRYNSI